MRVQEKDLDSSHSKKEERGRIYSRAERLRNDDESSGNPLESW